MPGVGIGPGPVEHVFAVRMGFEVERAGCTQPAFAGRVFGVPHRHQLQLPAGLGDGAAAVLQGCPIGWGDKRVDISPLGGFGGQQGVPVACIHLAGMAENPNDIIICDF